MGRVQRSSHVVSLIGTLAAAFALAGCASGGSAAPHGSGAAAPRQSQIERTPFDPSLNVNLSTMTKTPSGLYYRDIEEGTGAVVRPRDEARVHYTGWLSNGQKFDSNADNEEPLRIPLGRGRAIKGWDEGLVGMRVGGTRQLVVPPELGYGSNRTGLIPSDAVLVFVVTVVLAK
jgi:FKBP-type peptidyl-prolyl cis-trans isomerase